MRALLATQHDVFLQPMHVDPPLPADIAHLLTRRLEAPFDLLLHHTDPGQLGIPEQARRAATTAVAWTMWESSSLDNLRGKSTLRRRLRDYDLVLGYDAVTTEALRPYVRPRTTWLGTLQGGFWPEDWKPIPRDWHSERLGFAMHGQLHAQPLTARVLTPTGWVLLGELTVGDSIVDPSGGFQKVEGVSPRKTANIYEVEFSDGAITQCTSDHLWRVNRKTWRNSWETEWVILSTEALASEGLRTPGNNWRFRVPSPVVDFEEVSELPIDPYLVGALCGDGCFSGTSVGFTNVDVDCLAEVVKVLPPGVTLVQKPKQPKQWSLQGVHHVGERVCLLCGTMRQLVSRGLCGRCLTAEARAGRREQWGKATRASEVGIMRRLLTEIGIGREVCPDKFIPVAYLFADRDSRLALLQGLLDTDGWVGGRGSSAKFGSSSPALVDAVVWLARSLGGTASVGRFVCKSYTYQGEKKYGKPHRAVHVLLPEGMSPFRMARKRTQMRESQQDFLSRKIVAIRACGEAESRCISVSGTSGTYVTDDFVVTHNTRKDPFVAIQAFQELKTEQPEKFAGAELHLHTTLPGLHPAMEECIPKLRIHYEVWNVDVLREFYGRQHVLLVPSRGEGKHLPSLEFQSTGGVVIATNWGGIASWLSPSFAYPLNYSLVPIDGAHPQCLQARADKDHLKQLMWHVYSHRAEARLKGEQASRIIPISMNWPSVIDRLFDILGRR